MKRIFRHFTTLFITIYVLSQTASATTLLIPGGQVIGMHLQDETVTVADFDEELGQAARSAGLRQGDRLLTIDGKPIHCANDVSQALRSSKGKVKLSVQRGGKTKSLTLCPATTPDGPKLGVFLRQGCTGLGTVTYYTESGDFGALGHGVNDQTGKLLRLTDGSIYPARVEGVKKGKIGAPGQLMGAVTDSNAMGDLGENTIRGVFGKCEKTAATPLPAAKASQVKTGKATILSTVTGNTPQEYSVEILKIYPNTDNKTRNLLLHVTDPALLNATGGIVQGMSGSPIIQDGKLVGAVTHVLVNDPTTGYGIFIENMLNAA